ncbi:MAG: hypothetical protein LBS50_06850 [Prevotellaceae bacterium]|jgi:tetratricopeptide (TPR) repeat protein|nr:hypothetical protein [Prevotellaceae bacterium]
MKKIFSIFAMLLIVTACCFAQQAKKDVKKAFKKADADPTYDAPDFNAALNLIEDALKADETIKTDPYTWWVYGYIYDRQIAYEIYKQGMGQSFDEEVKQESAYNAYDYFVKAAELYSVPDAKGKIDTKSIKKIRESLIWYFTTGLIVNYGATQTKYEETYPIAVKAFEKHLAIPDLSFIVGQKDAPHKENNDSLYWNIKYYEAQYTQLSGDIDGATQKWEAIKNQGFREYLIYNFLYSIYKEKKDSANAVKIINEGIEHFPDSILFTELLIDHYIKADKAQEAVAALDQAIEKQPGRAGYYGIKADILGIIGKSTEANQCIDKAMELDPTSPKYIVQKGNLLFEQAREMESATLSIRDARQAASLVAASKAKFTEAKNFYLNALNINPDYIEALEKLRSIYLRFNDDKNYEAVSAKIRELKR